MYNTNVQQAKNNLKMLVDMAIKGSETINIVSEKGNVVMIDESSYNSMQETIYLLSKPLVKQEIIDGLNTPLEKCEELDWDNIE